MGRLTDRPDMTMDVNNNTTIVDQFCHMQNSILSCCLETVNCKKSSFRVSTIDLGLPSINP